MTTFLATTATAWFALELALLARARRVESRGAVEAARSDARRIGRRVPWCGALACGAWGFAGAPVAAIALCATATATAGLAALAGKPRSGDLPGALLLLAGLVTWLVSRQGGG